MGNYMPTEKDIERVEAETGMQRMQAIRHLQGRKWIREQYARDNQRRINEFLDRRVLAVA